MWFAPCSTLVGEPAGDLFQRLVVGVASELMLAEVMPAMGPLVHLLHVFCHKLIFEDDRERTSCRTSKRGKRSAIRLEYAEDKPTFSSRGDRSRIMDPQIHAVDNGKKFERSNIQVQAFSTACRQPWLDDRMRDSGTGGGELSVDPLIDFPKLEPLKGEYGGVVFSRHLSDQMLEGPNCFGAFAWNGADGIFDYAEVGDHQFFVGLHLLVNGWGFLRRCG